MNAKGCGNLIDRVVALDGCYRDLGFEIGAMILSLLIHLNPSFLSSDFITLVAGPNFGEHYRSEAEMKLKLVQLQQQVESGSAPKIILP
ncbi:MAG TPA: hypothetical protein VE732_05335, partial [Nitrososphaera sp.]|nr:hypothetical protein [Nitrososphaera sp.]